MRPSIPCAPRYILVQPGQGRAQVSAKDPLGAPLPLPAVLLGVTRCQTAVSLLVGERSETSRFGLSKQRCSLSGKAQGIEGEGVGSPPGIAHTQLAGAPGTS